MRILIEELQDVLSDEFKLYKEMLQITTQKTDIITSGKINDLDSITHLENSMILNLGKLEERREKVLNNIEKHLGAEEKLTIADILSQVNDSDGIRQKIEGVANMMSQVLDELKEKNDLNGLLIKDTLEYIELNINLLTNVSERGIYNNKVQKENTAQKISLFDSKA
ncbi:MAG: flagellar protein FlgN [Tissierellales bacterium]